MAASNIAVMEGDHNLEEPGKTELQVDRVILARIRGCRDTTKLQGAACTNRCGNRGICKNRRTPFLIPTEAFELQYEKRPYSWKGKTRHRLIPKASQINEGGITLVELKVIGIPAPDDYINDIFGAFSGR